MNAFSKKYIQSIIKIDQIFHNWEKLIGRVGKLYINQQDDDSNTNFRWNEKTNQLEGRLFYTNNGHYYLALQVDDASFHVYDKKNKRVATIQTVGFSYVNVINNLKTVLSELGLDTSNFSEELVFRYQQHFNASGIAESIDDKALNSWTLLRSTANLVLKNVLSQLNKESEIRLWPTNFDTGIFIDYHDGLTQFAGFSPADHVCDELYFYNSFYSNNNKVVPQNWSTLEHGYWESQKWAGAVLPISKFLDVQGIKSIAEQFLLESTKVLSQYAKK